MSRVLALDTGLDIAIMVCHTFAKGSVMARVIFIDHSMQQHYMRADDHHVCVLCRIYKFALQYIEVLQKYANWRASGAAHCHCLTGSHERAPWQTTLTLFWTTTRTFCTHKRVKNRSRKFVSICHGSGNCCCYSCPAVGSRLFRKPECGDAGGGR